MTPAQHDKTRREDTLRMAAANARLPRNWLIRRSLTFPVEFVFEIHNDAGGGMSYWMFTTLADAINYAQYELRKLSY